MKAVICIVRTFCFVSMLLCGCLSLFCFIDLHFQAVKDRPGEHTQNILLPHVSFIGMFVGAVLAIVSAFGAFREYED